MLNEKDAIYKLMADRELAKRYLIDFTQLTFPEYKPSWHHILLAAELEKVEKGEIDRLIILMPPRHGKSELASIRFPAWYLGKNPDNNIITCSYNSTLAAKFGMKARNLVQSDIYHNIFGNIKIRDDSRAKQVWNLENHRGSYIAAGVGGGITGLGGNVLIIDDPIKNADEANSQTYRDRVWNWYTSTAYTRLENPGAIIIILTRWHEDDLAGRLLAAEKKGGDIWKLLKLPAIAEDKEDHRLEGEPLWQDKFNLTKLKRIKRVTGNRDFESLYQQNPSAQKGEILKRAWWKYYKETPKAYERIIQTWDTAFEKGKNNDYSVCQTWMETKEGFYLIDIWREKVEFPELKRQTIALYNKYKPSVVLIEQKASGHSLIQELKRETKIPIKEIKPDKDKITRVYAITPTIESGNVFLNENANWLHDFIDECSKFPNSKHDDQVDAMSQALNYLRRRGAPRVRFI